jgi:hypothetical protein
MRIEQRVGSENLAFEGRVGPMDRVLAGGTWLGNRFESGQARCAVGNSRLFLTRASVTFAAGGLCSGTVGRVSVIVLRKNSSPSQLRCLRMVIRRIGIRFRRAGVRLCGGLLPVNAVAMKSDMGELSWWIVGVRGSPLGAVPAAAWSAEQGSRRWPQNRDFRAGRLSRVLLWAISVVRA